SSIPQLPLELAIVEGATRGNRDQAAPAERMEREPEPVPDFDDPRPGSSPQPRTTLRDRVRGAPAPRNRVAGSDRSPQPETRQPPAVEQRTTNDRDPHPVTREPVLSPSPGSRAATGDLSVETIVDLWPQIRADVKALNRRIEALLQQVDPAAVTGSQVLLVSPYEFHRNRINTDEVRLVIEGVIGRLIGSPVQVSCVSREDADRVRSSGSAPGSALAATERRVRDDRTGSPETAASTPGNPDEPPSAPGLTDEEKEERITAARNIFDAVPIDD
ncbi:MAG TPA: hypothetical protein VD767_05200, partial [Thermomicrobiales bacterium]|nr:hypothetical protein [Thermomicrobiales bacterium]